MKNICFILLFTTGFALAQNDLIGTWYLDAFTINGNTYQNLYGNLPMIFTNEPDVGEFLTFDGASSCNAIFGPYSYDNEEIIFYGIGMTAADCGTEPRGQFEDLYLPLLSNNYTSNSVFTYAIVGSGSQQTLTLTNSSNDQILYSKTENNAILNGTWYLQTIQENGTTYNVNSPDSPTLTLGTNSPDEFFGYIIYNGEGICNTFDGEYRIYFGNGDEISISSFVPTLNICNPPSEVETAYFNILADETNNIFSFEIANDGDNLILTSISGTGGRSSNTVGDILSFSKQPLSIDELNYSVSSIALLENPLTNQLKLKVNDNILLRNINYQIFSIDGKIVYTSNLISRTIDVSSIHSGIYFISLMENNSIHTIKFIKK